VVFFNLQKHSIQEERNVSVNVPHKTADCPILSVEEWIPWQNRLQDVHFVQHSLESNHLVDLMEFINIQSISFIQHCFYHY